MKHVIVVSKLVISILIVLFSLPIKAIASSPLIDFEQHVISDHIPNSPTVEVTDIDGDGDNDLFGSDRQNNKLYLYLNDGSQNFTELVIDNIDAYRIDAGDIDQDGDMDLAVVGFAIYGYEGHWYENQGNLTFVRHRFAHWGRLDPNFVHIIDFDRDGDLDFTANANGWNHAHIYWYENDGSENFAEHEILDLYAPQNHGCQTTVPTDVDSDGDFDLIQACDSSPTFWLINDGNQNFTRQDISRNYSFSPYNLQVFDMDHDGDIDVLVPDINDGTFWLENDGSQQFIEHRISSNRLAITTVWVVDIDHDGDEDVVEADHGLNQVFLWINQGNMTFTESILVNNLGGVLSVFVTDLDQDEDEDIIVDEFYVGKLSWFEQKSANQPPYITSLIAPATPVQIGQTITATANFNDPNSGDTHTAQWNWDDGSTTTISATQPTASASHNYAIPGVYTITVTITDSAGEADTEIFQYVVIYDPNGGFVTGGGRINSPLGAYTPDPDLTGKATFGFVSKYQKGASVPTGNTEFQFHVADMNFKSTSYDWLVIAGSKAQYKGTGTINGAGEYKFLLTAIDGAPDKFRIKIWDKVTGNVIYDNMLGAADDANPSTAIEGGSIVIHKAK